MTDLEKILADYQATQGCHSSFEFQRLQTAVAHIPELARELQELREAQKQKPLL